MPAGDRGGGVREYTVINIGHPEVPISDLAEMIRRELGAPPDLITTRDLPSRMTLVKRPLLERQRHLLGIEPRVSLFNGVRLVCRRVREGLAAGELAAQ